MDDPDIDALPSSASVIDQIGLAQKHCQIGRRACAQIVSTVQDELDDSARRAILVVDLGVQMATWSRGSSM